MLKAMHLPKLTRLALAILLTAAASGLAAPGSDSASPQAQVAETQVLAAGIERYASAHPKAARLFVDTNDDPREQAPQWREFSAAKAVTGDHYSSANVWARGGKTILADMTFDAASGDWSRSASYFFRPDGTLAKLDTTLSTFHSEDGHPLRVREVRFYDAAGRVLSTSTTYRDAKTSKLKKSASYHKNEPPLYSRVSRLPFYALLQKPRR